METGTKLAAVSDALGRMTARAAAWMVGRAHRVVHLPMYEHECEEQGLPYGSTEPAVFSWGQSTAKWWRVDVWVERPTASDAGGAERGEHCLKIDAFSQHIEVFYLRGKEPAAPEGTASAF